MARQLLSHRKVRRLRQQTGLPVVAVQVRGGSGHRRDLCLADGRVILLFQDGSMEDGGRHGLDPELLTPMEPHAAGSAGGADAGAHTQGPPGNDAGPGAATGSGTR